MATLAASDQLRYYARDFGDPIAQLFWVDDALYCGLTPSQTAMLDEASATGVLDKLIDGGFLLPTSPVASSIDGFDRVLRLDRLPRISYCFEWCPAMWKAAALHLIDMLITLHRRGFTLSKPNPWNVLFTHGRPIYIHPGSVVKFDIAITERSYEKICRFFLRPLLLAESGFGHAARRLQHDVHEGVTPGDWPTATPEWAVWPRPLHENLEAFLIALRRQLESVTSTAKTTKFTDYYANGAASSRSLTYKAKVVKHLLDELQPASVADVASNAGLYSRLASQYGHEVIAIDSDEQCISRLYENTRGGGDNLLPIVMDLTNPSPGYGVCNDWFPPATTRLKGDLVLALAIEHHLVFGRHRLTFDQIARAFASFCNRSLLVEFVPAGTDTNANPQEWRPESERWYTLEQFADTFAQGFSAVTVLPKDTDSSRRLLLCEHPHRWVA